MKPHDADRITKAEFRDFIRRMVAWLKRLPGSVRFHFARDNRTAEPPPGSREPGALPDPHERVECAALDAGSKGAESEEGFRFNDDDLAFLSEVAGRLAPLAAQPNLAPEDARAIERAVAALRNLPQLTPGIDVLIEVAHRMGGDGFSESYSYTVKLDQRGIGIVSSGSQCGPAVGSDAFSLETLQWYADGQVAHRGNRDTWLERLSYALARDHTLNVTDKSDGQGAETV